MTGFPNFKKIKEKNKTNPSAHLKQYISFRKANFGHLRWEKLRRGLHKGIVGSWERTLSYVFFVSEASRVVPLYNIMSIFVCVIKGFNYLSHLYSIFHVKHFAVKY